MRALLLIGAVAASAAAAQGPAPEPPEPPEPMATATARNVYLAAGQVRPDGPVAGDFVAIGGRVIIDEPVKGDVMAAGGAVDLRAPLGDDLRAVAGDIAIDAGVGGEVFAAGGSVTVARGARIERAATLFGGSVRVDGAIGGTLTSRGQRIAINGAVTGDVDLAGEQIALGPGARIGGKLRYASPNELQRSEGATVAGGITRVADEAMPGGSSEHRGGRPGREWGDNEWHAMGRGASSGGGWFGAVLTFLALLASGALLLLIFPRFAAESADTVRRAPGLALLFGLAALVAVPVLAVLLFITLLGIPLGIALLALYPLLLLGGYVVGVFFIARRAQAALRPAEEAPSQVMTLGFFALALLLVTLLGRLPFVGGLVMAVIALLGIGACLLEIHRRRQAGAGAPPLAAS